MSLLHKGHLCRLQERLRQVKQLLHDSIKYRAEPGQSPWSAPHAPAPLRRSAPWSAVQYLQQFVHVYGAPTAGQAAAWLGKQWDGVRSLPWRSVDPFLHINTTHPSTYPELLCARHAGHRPPSLFAYSWHSVVDKAQALAQESLGFESWLSHSQAARSWSSSFVNLGLSFPPLENGVTILSSWGWCEG